MTRIHPSRQVSIVALHGKNSYEAKRPTIHKKTKNENHTCPYTKKQKMVDSLSVENAGWTLMNFQPSCDHLRFCSCS